MLHQLIPLIESAGIIALEAQKSLTRNHKADTSLVTNGDILVSQFLEAELKKSFPDFDVFSEENCTTLPKSNKVFVVDPIDGTESYSRFQDTWSILVGIMIDEKIEGGVVYQPTKKHLYYTHGNESFFVDGTNPPQKLAATADGEIKGLTSPKNYGESDFFKQLGITNLTPMYSAALKIMEVSKGTGDIYPNLRKACSIWDLVAPMAILEKAGGRMYFQSPQVFSFEKPSVPVDFCAVGSRIDYNPFEKTK